MVKTRSRAKQESAQTSGSPTKHSLTSPSALERAKRESDERSTSRSVEELALRAFNNIQKRFESKTGSRDRCDLHSEDSGAEASAPDVLPLQSASKEPAESMARRGAATVLASSLQPVMEVKPYFSFSKGRTASSARKPCPSWEEGDQALMAKSVITPDFEMKRAVPPIFTTRSTRERAKKAARERSTGKGWHAMEAPKMTPELQNDLRVLKMRGTLDPSQHYKTTDWKTLPKFFQVGHVVSGPADFYSGRVVKKQRRKTIVEELLADQELRKYHKTKYLELQRKFSSGTTRHKSIKHKKKYKK